MKYKVRVKSRDEIENLPDHIERTMGGLKKYGTSCYITERMMDNEEFLVEHIDEVDHNQYEYKGKGGFYLKEWLIFLDNDEIVEF